MAQHEEKYTRRRLASSYFTTIVSISLVLFLLGTVGLVLLYAQRLSQHVKENIGVSVSIRDGVRESEVLKLQKKLDAMPWVKSTRYITAEEAAKDLSVDLGEDFVGFLGFNPLLPSIEVKMNAGWANMDSIPALERKIIAEPEVKEVQYQKSLINLVNENVRRISLVLFGFSALLMVIAFALINNTIRLSVYSRRFLIRTMLLVGATQAYVQRPFLIKGVLQGVAGSLVAILLLISLLIYGSRELPDLISLAELNLYLILFGIVLFLGIALSWISNYLAVRKYLRIDPDNLYF
ncbi:MAG TPA: cell division protein FtsX [Bacteroidales bacterium]|nr:MAG: cell division protein FtsX [Bacteroidetes bacterium GWE2_42_24]OFY30452.1 MAG: cell division protein FtsX [Bacteroidetes bacterium GWF2_43_11]HAQ65910.1 cell division protein FtsX [Bacteroidales bacterium]HBZ65313.1 cell division protein FtsX [Bacteroidales bacterium]